MFFKILKKDLQKKKVMNIILFVFMVFTSMLVATSGNIMYSATTALDGYFHQAKVADFTSFVPDDSIVNNRIEEFAKDNPEVANYYKDTTLMLKEDQVKLGSGKFGYSDTMLVSKANTEADIIFDRKTELGFTLHGGEISLDPDIMKKNHISLGDKISLQLGETKKEFLVKYSHKDALCGPTIMGVNRIFISAEDFQWFEQNNKPLDKVNIWTFNEKSGQTFDNFIKAYNEKDFPAIASFTQSTVKMAYIIDLVIVAIMAIVSMFLLLIAFLILRFTITFTLQEDFKQIGIMKAIGMKASSIKRLYLVKYTAIAVVGGVIGFLTGIPFANSLLNQVSENIIIPRGGLAYVVAGVSVCFEIALVMGFCNLCTRKIKKITAIDAIRNGENGKSFVKKQKVHLYKSKRFQVPYFLATNDIMSHFRRYSILFVTFMLGTILLIVPTNLINTINSDSIMSLFGTSSYNISVEPNQLVEFGKEETVGTMNQQVEKVQKKCQENGLDAKFRIEMMFSLKMYGNNEKDSLKVATRKYYDYSTANMTMLSGVAPKYENEMALGKKVAEYFELKLGDSFHCVVNGKDQKVILTGIFQSMTNLGTTAMFSDEMNPEPRDFSVALLLGDVKGKLTDEQATKKFEKIYPGLDAKTMKENVQDIMSGTNEQLGTIRILIVALILGINFLITVLTGLMILSKEFGEVAILKSMGFANGAIRKWQITRILIVLVLAVALGVICSGVVGDFLVGGLFAMLGATKVSLIIEPLQVYVLFPLLLLGVTFGAAFIATNPVKSVKVWEIGEVE